MFRAKWVYGEEENFEFVMNIRHEVLLKELGMGVDAVNDEFDPISASILVLDESDRFVATGRVHPSADGWKFGRIAVLEDSRGKGYGGLVMRMLAFKTTNISPSSFLAAEVPKQIMPFFSHFGFEQVSHGEQIDEANESALMTVLGSNFKWNAKCGGHC